VAVGAAGSSGDFPHLAILPYPSRHEREWQLEGGLRCTVRPIQPDDAEMLQGFVRGLSQQSRWFRFASHMPELPARMLARYTLIDYDREMALVAVAADAAAPGGRRMLGVVRYITNPDGTSCEFSLAVADDVHGRGLGSRMMLSIIEAARAKGLQRIIGLILAENTPMLKLMNNLGFGVQPFAEDPDFRMATKAL
jgi:acetyltransferase